MWKKIVSLSEDNQSVIAKLSPDFNISNSFDSKGLSEVLKSLGAEDFFVIEEEVSRFINLAKEEKGESYSGVTVAEVRDAEVKVELSENDMLASMIVTGAYKGQPLKGPQIVKALSDAQVTKGINKLALKKVLMMSHQLKPGETFTQPVARGKDPVQGKDSRFIAMVADPTKQILAPKTEGEGKVDMLNLGETITVAENDVLMKRVPATKGTAGITVQGKVIPPKPGTDTILKPGKGSEISPSDPNQLIAVVSGMPVIKEKTVDVEDALCLPAIGVATGHVKFKGNVVVLGNIESDMMVRVTGSLTVGGFIESADIQVQGDIEVAKGIIGHTMGDDGTKSCVVKSGGTIRANYAQYSELQASENIELAVHCMNNEIRCGGDLVVCDSNERQGTIGGGSAKAGGKVTCVQLGVEGDTATEIHAFARFGSMKERQSKFKEHYNLAQEATMDVVRKELEFKKKPKAERSEEVAIKIEKMKAQSNERLEKAKAAREQFEADFEALLEENVVEVKNKVFSHVTVLFGDEKVRTKRSHGPSRFSFDQFAIKFSSLLGDEAFEDENDI
ncbi:DUF342 domain-containing protein [Vibrio sonorensis]|uniref:DUF342 domain-containing protein n=1 Tax=Vibrio sonorensis TaxID=1004316 RepID=UPI0008D92CC2|nr:FapA family protein [Vibrio sonorensis]